MSDQTQQAQQQSQLPINNFFSEPIMMKPYSNSWTPSKEMFLCRKVLNYMPEILLKSKTSLWKKVLDDFNTYFNGNGYRIRQPRTMRDKFLRLYTKFVHDNKPVEEMGPLETVLHQIRLMELDRSRGYKSDNSGVQDRNNTSLDEEMDEDEDIEAEEEEDLPHIVQPPIVPTQHPHSQFHASQFQPDIPPVDQSQQNPQQQQPPPQLNQNSPTQQQQHNYQQGNAKNVLLPSPSNSSGYATIHFKLPTEVRLLNMKIENMENDISTIKKDVDVIKTQLNSVLNILKKLS